MDKKTIFVEKYEDEYQNGNVDGCSSALLILALLYNSELEEKQYNHGIKRLLLKNNYIRNPLGYAYSEEDYHKTKHILDATLKLLQGINDRETLAQEESFFREDLQIAEEIIMDIADLAVYTECFYRMNQKNTERIQECIKSTDPFVEQVFSIVLFFQDQIRILKKDITALVDGDCMTGMELSIANRPADHCQDVKVSVSDNLEANMEGMDALVRYLFFLYKGKMADHISKEAIDTGLIRPYENIDFERLLHVANQRYLLCRLEEKVRYGYLGIKSIGKTEEGERYYYFGIEQEEKYKAHVLGRMRREYMFRQHALMDVGNMPKINAAQEQLQKLADALLGQQEEGFAVFAFDAFHPDQEIYEIASGIVEAKVRVTKALTKEYYLDRVVKDVCIRDFITAFTYLATLAEILFQASVQVMEEEDQATYCCQLSILEVAYLEEELARLYGFSKKQSHKLIGRFVFHEKNNQDDDLFAQPLVKVSKTQVLFSEALFDQVNLDRSIERQFIRYDKNVSQVGHEFEKDFLRTLKKGYKKGILDRSRKPIPNFSINTQTVKYIAFDDREIEFDFVAVLGDYLLLAELKAVMTSYDLDDLVNREENVDKAIEQLKRREKSVQHDWEKIRAAADIELPEKPYDPSHIIKVACMDTYDYTPMVREGIYVTDDSVFLKYFTNPYIDAVYQTAGGAAAKRVRKLWKKDYPDAEELMDYLAHPLATEAMGQAVEKTVLPIPRIDGQDLNIYSEELRLTGDPIKKAASDADVKWEEAKEDSPKGQRKKKKIYPNDPCPCGSGRKYKKCCGKG